MIFTAAPYIFLSVIRKENRMKPMNDFTKSNNWKNFKKKMETPAEKGLYDYISLLERQIVTLEQMINSMTIDKEDDRK